MKRYYILNVQKIIYRFLYSIHDVCFFSSTFLVLVENVYLVCILKVDVTNIVHRDKHVDCDSHLYDQNRQKQTCKLWKKTYQLLQFLILFRWTKLSADKTTALFNLFDHTHNRYFIIV